MADKKRFILAHDTARQGAIEYVKTAPIGYHVVIEPPVKSRIQEEKYHAMIADVAWQCTFMGKNWGKEDWKRLLIDAFAKVMAENGTPLSHGGQIVPSLDGSGIVQLGYQSRDFRVKEAAEFIEYLYAYGCDNLVVWTDPDTVYQALSENQR